MFNTRSLYQRHPEMILKFHPNPATPTSAQQYKKHRFKCNPHMQTTATATATIRPHQTKPNKMQIVVKRLNPYHSLSDSLFSLCACLYFASLLLWAFALSLSFLVNARCDNHDTTQWLRCHHRRNMCTWESLKIEFYNSSSYIVFDKGLIFVSLVILKLTLGTYTQEKRSHMCQPLVHRLSR